MVTSILDSTPEGLSSWETSLFRHIQEHIRTEDGLIAAYETVAEESEAPHVAYLLGLIAEDEARHHRLWQEWLTALLAFVDEAPEGEVRVPELRREHHARRLVDELDVLVGFERADAKELRRLRRDLRSVEHVTIWPLLVELMEHDTAKHLAILEFLRKHAKGTARLDGSDLDP